MNWQTNRARSEEKNFKGKYEKGKNGTHHLKRNEGSKRGAPKVWKAIVNAAHRGRAKTVIFKKALRSEGR